MNGGFPVVCPFCESASNTLSFSGVYHPQKHDHGPFNIFRCTECGSAFTAPPPSQASLNALYESFDGGLPGEMRKVRSENPQTAWYQHCVDRTAALGQIERTARFRWVEIGAGEAEYARLLATEFPASSGIAADLHARPDDLRTFPSIEWRTVDVNDTEFPKAFPDRFDVVAAISVWEHVIDPGQFVRSLMTLLKPGGVLYLVCPNYGSIARRMLGKRWPFHTPGEHLCIPTIKGSLLCLERYAALFADIQSTNRTFSKPIFLPYTVRYVAWFLGLEGIARRVPSSWIVPVPAGALEAGLSPR